MSYIPKTKEYFEKPLWSGRLTNYYWVIRNEGRNKAKRRMYYRLVAKEKLRLAEQNIDQELIDAVCKYLCTYAIVCGRRMQDLMVNVPKQRSFDFRNGHYF